jgi:hypothetical protein
MEIILALLTGITSAVIYSLVQACYLYFRWAKTKRFFTQEIRALMLYTGYYVATILDIETIITTEYEEDHLLTHEEFITEIKFTQISNEQYKRLSKIIEETKSRIETLRKDALSVPIFMSSDFHAVDKFLRELGDFLSFYSWVKDESSDQDNDNRLKEKIVNFLNTAETNPFCSGFFDNLWKWYQIKKFSLKRLVSKKKRHVNNLLEESEIPF